MRTGMDRVVLKWRRPATVGLAGTGKSTVVRKLSVQNAFAGLETTLSQTTSNGFLLELYGI